MRKLFLLALLIGSAIGQLRAQSTEGATDRIVVVGNQAQPVQWNHRQDVASAIAKAQPNGTVIIPTSYAGTDCMPVATCLFGNVQVLDWRNGGGGNPPIGTAGQIVVVGNVISLANPATSPGAFNTNGPLTVNGPQSFIAFTPDNVCGFYATGMANDQLCDWTSPATGAGVLLFNPTGTLNQQVFVTRVQTLPPASGAGYFFNSAIQQFDLAAGFGVTPLGAVTSASETTGPLTATTGTFATSVQTPLEVLNGSGGGVINFVQGSLAQPQANSWSVQANPSEPVGGIIEVEPNATVGIALGQGPIGTLQATEGSGAIASVSPAAGVEVTGNITISNPGKYTVKPACWITNHSCTGGTPTCDAGALVGGQVTTPTITNGSTGCSGTATVNFSTQEEKFWTQNPSFQRVNVVGSQPGCVFTSGGGTSPSCTLDTGSTDSAGIIIATTGTGAPAGQGSITLTFTSAFGTNKPACQFMASDNGAGAWANVPGFKDQTSTVNSDVFKWANGATLTALSTSTAYRINYQCWGK